MIWTSSVRAKVLVSSVCLLGIFWSPAAWLKVADTAIIQTVVGHQGFSLSSATDLLGDCGESSHPAPIPCLVLVCLVYLAFKCYKE